MKMTHAKSPLPAAKELLKHIRDAGMMIPDWCELHDLDRYKVQDAIKGRILRIDVDFAFEVERVTGGAVKAEGWCPTKKARAEMKRRRDAAKGKAA